MGDFGELVASIGYRLSTWCAISGALLQIDRPNVVVVDY